MFRKFQHLQLLYKWCVCMSVVYINLKMMYVCVLYVTAATISFSHQSTIIILCRWCAHFIFIIDFCINIRRKMCKTKKRKKETKNKVAQCSYTSKAYHLIIIKVYFSVSLSFLLVKIFTGSCFFPSVFSGMWRAKC